MRSLQIIFILSIVVALSAAAHDVFSSENAEQNVQERSYRYNTNMLDLTSLNGKNYFFSIYQKMTFMDAMNYCLNFGLDLASVNSNQEQTVIDAHINSISLQTQNFFLSGNKVGNKDVWYWLDGTLVSLPFWNPGEPNNGYNCMGIYNGLWYDLACDTANYFVCEEPVASTTPLSSTTTPGSTEGTVITNTTPKPRPTASIN